MPPPVNISIISIEVGPTHHHSITCAKSTMLVSFHYTVEDVVIATTTLSPVFKFIKLWCQAICPGTPTVIGKTAPERNKS
jgi:hypothetical protein